MGNSKISISLKTTHRRAKRTKIWVFLKVIWGHSVHFSENWPETQKRLIVEQNRRKCGPGGVCIMHIGIFDLEHIKVIWGHSVHFSENWAVTQKRFIIERNGRKFGPRGCM